MRNGNLPQPSEPSRSSAPPSNAGTAPSTSNAGASPSTTEEPRLNVAEILAVLRREKWVILLICVLVTGAVAGYTYMQPSVYESSSIVKIDPESSGSMKVAEGIGGEEGVGEAPTVPGEIGVLKNSLELAEKVAGRLREQSEMQTTNARFPVWEKKEALVDQHSVQVGSRFA